MDKTKNKDTGNVGEQIAADYLISIGYKIIDRNLKLICGEVDILALDRKIIVIVEVKTVRGSGFGLAQELVRYKKQKKLLNLARSIEQKYPARRLRIDVIGVSLDCYPPKVEHLISAVEGK